MINKSSKIFLAGHRGLLGSAILRSLKKKGYKNILTIDKKKLDLRNQTLVSKFVKKHKPKFIIIAAAKVGGIYANNSYRAEFIYDNLQIQNNLINSAYVNKIKNLIFFGSSCIYPKYSSQPIKEKYLLTGALENTNEPYAIAKIAGIKLCENYNIQYGTNYRCLMPTNIYGPNDNYNLETSHFYPALIRRIYFAKIKNLKSIKLWGTGNVKRELIYVDDVAEACIYFMNRNTKETLINIGCEKDYSIKYYASFLKKLIKTKVDIKFDNNKMYDGTPRKLLNSSIARKYGWKAKTSLTEGTIKTYQDFLLTLKRSFANK